MRGLSYINRWLGALTVAGSLFFGCKINDRDYFVKDPNYDGLYTQAEERLSGKRDRVEPKKEQNETREGVRRGFDGKLDSLDVKAIFAVNKPRTFEEAIGKLAEDITGVNPKRELDSATAYAAKKIGINSINVRFGNGKEENGRRGIGIDFRLFENSTSYLEFTAGQSYFLLTLTINY